MTTDSQPDRIDEILSKLHDELAARRTAVLGGDRRQNPTLSQAGLFDTIENRLGVLASVLKYIDQHTEDDAIISVISMAREHLSETQDLCWQARPKAEGAQS